MRARVCVCVRGGGGALRLHRRSDNGPLHIHAALQRQQSLLSPGCIPSPSWNSPPPACRSLRPAVGSSTPAAGSWMKSSRSGCIGIAAAVLTAEGSATVAAAEATSTAAQHTTSASALCSCLDIVFKQICCPARVFFAGASVVRPVQESAGAGAGEWSSREFTNVRIDKLVQCGI